MLSIGMSSHNFKNQIASDIPVHGQFVHSQELKSQEFIKQIDQWTKKQKMEINENKTNAMIINFTNLHQFTSRIELKGKPIEIVNKLKILGVTVTDTLDWSENTGILVRKVNMTMQLLRSVWGFGASPTEMVHLWKLFCLSVLEQSCVVWGGSLTKENEDDLERT